MKVTIEDFWYWVNERHRIYLNRQEGKPQPWTEDPVLQQFRFTNVFRQFDRGTWECWKQLDRIPYDYNGLSHQPFWEEGMIFANIVFYRVFNKPETADAAKLPILDEVHLNNAIATVSRLNTPFTGAHMQLWGDGAWMRIWRETWQWKTDLAREIVEGQTVENATAVFRRLHNTGPFFSHQFAQDARHRLIPNAPDGDSWTQLGPGSSRCLEWMGKERTLEALLEIWREQDQYRADYVPSLEAKDVQQSLCEVQKYVKLRHMLQTGERCKVRKFP